jgi:hypothetical protein
MYQMTYWTYVRQASIAGDIERRRVFRDPPVHRRAFLAAVGTGAVAGTAGCGFGGDETVGDGETAGSGTNGPSAAETTVGADGISRYDVALTVVRVLPGPVGRQFQRYGPKLPELGGMLDYVVLARSPVDMAFHGELAEAWTYRPGVLEIDLHDDVSYWDGTPVDAGNLRLHWRLEEHLAGEGGPESHRHVTGVERTGDHSLRVEFDDDYREDYALANGIAGWHPRGSGAYYRPWLEQFEDATSGDARDGLRVDLLAATEDSPDPFYYNAFRIVDADDDGWSLRLRSDEAPTPRYVERINYLRFEIGIRSPVEEARIRERQPFYAGRDPSGSARAWEPENLSFETERISLPRRFGRWAFLFDCAAPPTEDPRFRRALAYIIDREAMLGRAPTVPSERTTPFMTPEREERYVSRELLDSLETFGWNEVREAAATREMEAAGYERDADGRWRFRAGERAGEPMTLTVYGFPWQERTFGEERGIRRTLEEWGLGIDFEILESPFAPSSREDARISTSIWGGGVPERALAITFGEATGPGTGTPRLPATVEAPPVGEPWPDHDGEPETYDARAMTERLPVVRDEEQYQRIVDRLVWVFNQTVPRLGVEGDGRFFLLNTTTFDVALPGEAPALWTHVPHRRIWNKGIVAYVPPDER